MNQDEDDTLLSLSEMKRWLEIELRSVHLAAERRAAEANLLVEQYLAGDTNRVAANHRLKKHEAKWGTARLIQLPVGRFATNRRRTFREDAKNA